MTQSPYEQADLSRTQDVAEGEVERFWLEARRQARLDTMPGYFGPSTLGALPPPTWSFGDDEAAERLLEQVLTGVRTAATSARADYESEDDLPARGQMSILVDALGHPRALLVTTEVAVVALDEVDEEHARAEGGSDLAAWRRDQETFLAAHDPADRGVGPDMPLVLERFALLHPSRESRATFRAMFGG